MIDLKTFNDLANIPVESFAPKPTSLTEGQLEAAVQLWASEDGLTKIGVWECTPGDFTADRSTVAEYCHIISGRASVKNHDGSGTRDIGPGDLLILPVGWKGAWTIHSHIRKLYVLQTSA
ncbi:hypothetical protein SAMN05444414_1347 [Roseovarius marisflavi]|uniref:(S)-ureidoglycine aminohydrolase cupin domain-containing protein n=1 Tax=Roseovarius marisflavi TaxID=1054996 RepID=A0A1M7D3P6_9RHOB|nr:cupin domain-containing protein [Roseovarius marisflavi]SHL74162.1 hypothetical protein SAMN05444414_1347 [Roseovarius marisflavi]